MTTTAAYEQALAAWQAQLGSEHVLINRETLRHAATATFATTNQVRAILQPGSREEVGACLAIACAYQVPIYPVSAGKNWGYGSRVPWGDQQVILSLHRLNRILAFDDQLATITVEPGVTFQQLYTFLAEQGASVTIAGPGSTLQASVVGNTVERGLALGFGGEKWSQVAALEVLLPDGRIIHTGSGRYHNSTHAATAVAGPQLQGLFTQFNGGIVLSLILYLTPIPAFHQSFSFAIHGSDKLTAVLTAVQSLLRTGVLEVACGLYNDYKLLSYTDCSPPEGKLLTRPAFTAEMRRLLNNVAWWGESLVSAPTEATGALKRRLIKDTLGAVTDDLSFEPAGTHQPFIYPPAHTSLDSTYWRKRQSYSGDPDQDRCGVIWHSPVLPFQPEAIQACIATAETTLTEFQFEPILGLQCHSFRSVYMILSILYDREQPTQEEQALACYTALVSRLAAQGYYPYRAGTQSVGKLPRPDDDTLSLLRSLKHALDPYQILAPGHYDDQAYTETAPI